MTVSQSSLVRKKPQSLVSKKYLLKKPSIYIAGRIRHDPVNRRPVLQTFIYSYLHCGTYRHSPSDWRSVLQYSV